MAWQIVFETDDGEKVVNLDDLSPEVFQRIAKEEKDSNLSYWGVYMFPKESPEILYKVLCAAAEHAGIPAPDRAESMRAIQGHNAMFTEAPDIAKMPMQGGFPQEPGETEAGSSSTSPGLPTDGPTTPSDEPQ